jgi:NTP pyrophosphatase (non-canonical NTP hydrolase)
MAKKEPEGFMTDDQKKKIEEAAERVQKNREQSAEVLTVDLDKYSKFVQVMTSKPSKEFDAYVERITELKENGCDVSRLNTAAVGIVAEAGEFAEIVKKILFQGKEYNQDNIDHMIIELGDILWYISQAATALGVRLDDILLANTFKLLKRYPDGEFDVLKSEYRAPNDL